MGSAERTTRSDRLRGPLRVCAKGGDGKVSEAVFDGPDRHSRALDRHGDGFLSEDAAAQGPPPDRKPI